VTETVEQKVPDIGDFTDVEIIEVHVSAGDTVAVEDPLITLETDKASMDVPATVAGKVSSVEVAQGDRVSEGSLIAHVETGEAGGDAEDASPETVDGEADEPAAGSGEERAPGAEAAGGESRSVLVPDIGDFTDVDIIEVHVGTGDQVAAEDPLITLETDKASMDVPAPAAGTVESVAVSVGDKVSEGDLVLVLKAAGGAGEAPAQTDAGKEGSGKEGPGKEASPKKDAGTEDSGSGRSAPSGPAEPAAGKAPARTPAVAALPAVDEEGFAKAHASPSVRRFARELGVDLGRVSGSGVKGRITREDVKAYVKAALEGEPAPGVQGLPPVPEVDHAKYGEIEVKPLSRVQKISGPRLHASWVNLPHVTQFDEADITELENRRQELKDKAAERGAKLTPLAFIMAAVVRTLQEFPVFNASLDAAGENLVLKKYFHIGFAADTPNGLVVPVIKNAEQRSLLGLARELGDLSAKARDGKLAATDMQGGCFTVSSLGGIGGTAFTPIINAPEVAILGVSRSSFQPVWVDGEFVPRLMLPLCLSYDHRVIDGAAAARFTRFLATQLEDPDGLILF
jgi:pyruvate dehydrogenase E2 component (dihydrolipoamide acetyltransferase)